MMALPLLVDRYWLLPRFRERDNAPPPSPPPNELAALMREPPTPQLEARTFAQQLAA